MKTPKPRRPSGRTKPKKATVVKRLPVVWYQPPSLFQRIVARVKGWWK